MDDPSINSKNSDKKQSVLGEIFWFEIFIAESEKTCQYRSINKYNSETEEKIENNIDNIFKILKFNEKLFINDDFVEKLKDLDSYKIIINDDVLMYMFKR